MTSAFVMACGIQLFYVAAGAGSPIVYIHGNVASSRWFSPVMEVPGYATYALDMPNFGRSQELPGEVDIHAYADCVKEFLDALGLEDPLIVAHSLGGAVSQSLAIRYPDRVKALMLVDSSSPKGLFTPPERYPFYEMMMKDRNIVAKSLAMIAPGLKDPAFLEALVDDAMKMAGKAWVGHAKALSAFDVSAGAASFGKPVLVIWGAGDYLVTRAMAEETAAAYPAAALRVLDGVGHSPMVEDPERFKALLKEFLGSL